MKLTPIHTGNFKLDGGAMFGVVPKVIWDKLNPADENNLCTWAMRCLLIETGNRKILIDNGIGNKQDAKFLGHYYLHGEHSLDSSLVQAGVSKNEITDVLLTHLHFDHCGGSIVRNDNDDLVTAFPNATYWSNQKHWEWAIHPNAREKASFLKENILPIAESGQLKFVPVVENGTVAFDNVPDISIRYAFGHTEAMMLPQINYKGKTVVFMADLLPAAAHIPLPYVMAYDMFPMKTLAEKKVFLEEAVANDYLLFFEHDPVHESATLTMTEKGPRVKATGTLEQMVQA